MGALVCVVELIITYENKLSLSGSPPNLLNATYVASHVA
jgi:hypothetical protein